MKIFITCVDGYYQKLNSVKILLDYTSHAHYQNFPEKKHFLHTSKKNKISTKG